MAHGSDPDRKAPNVGGKELPLRLATDPLIGYRTWLVWNGLSGLALASIFINYEWKTGVNTAQCFPAASGNKPHGDPAPSSGCACGFYINLPDQGFSEWSHLVARKVHATGQVQMTGRVIRCEKGYKAGAAEIVSPVLIEAPCRSTENGRYCTNGVTGIVLPRNNGITFSGVCDNHRVEPYRSITDVVIDASVWMREVRKAMKKRYPGIEFLSFIE
jgi:hypothetical protein